MRRNQRVPAHNKRICRFPCPCSVVHSGERHLRTIPEVDGILGLRQAALKLTQLVFFYSEVSSGRSYGLIPVDRNGRCLQLDGQCQHPILGEADYAEPIIPAPVVVVLYLDLPALASVQHGKGVTQCPDPSSVSTVPLDQVRLELLLRKRVAFLAVAFLAGQDQVPLIVVEYVRPRYEVIHMDVPVFKYLAAVEAIIDISQVQVPDTRE